MMGRIHMEILRYLFDYASSCNNVTISCFKFLHFITCTLTFYQAEISCSETSAAIGENGILFTNGNSVTLKYVTDSWGTDGNGFKMVITAYKDAKDYGCRLVLFCINRKFNLYLNH